MCGWLWKERLFFFLLRSRQDGRDALLVDGLLSLKVKPHHALSFRQCPTRWPQAH
jgi:hypothetical protein